jgi:DNA-binding phage protein
MNTITSGMDVVSQFIQTVESERIAKKMSVAELARRTEVARPYLHRVLSGQQKPSLEWAGDVAVGLGINVDFQKN